MEKKISNILIYRSSENEERSENELFFSLIPVVFIYSRVFGVKKITKT